VKRGEIWTLAGGSDYLGKPRPSVIVQHDRFDAVGSIVVCGISTEVLDVPSYRVTVEPSDLNGLRQSSSVMLDKIAAVPRAKLGRRIGVLEPAHMTRLDEALLIFLGLAGLTVGDDDAA
jgi:mRNA interferase MazF